MQSITRGALCVLALVATGSTWALACKREAGTVIAPLDGAGADVPLPSFLGEGPVGSALGPWSFPRSLEGVSDYNSDCRPTLSADGTVILFESTPNAGPPYDPVNHISGRFYPYEAEWDGAEWTNLHALDPTDFSGHNLPCVSADGQGLYTSSGRRTAESYDADAAAAPQLHVEYSMPGLAEPVRSPFRGKDRSPQPPRR
ncbi:MAG: hypothetical protein QF860_14225 [Planctomycetota bacterium]|nr:hypothetical protein [Planctomycetota bacterium]